MPSVSTVVAASHAPLPSPHADDASSSHMAYNVEAWDAPRSPGRASDFFDGPYARSRPMRAPSYGSTRGLYRQYSGSSRASDSSNISEDVARNYGCASIMARHTWVPTALFAACILGALALGSQIGCLISGPTASCPSRMAAGWLVGGLSVGVGLGVITLLTPIPDGSNRSAA